MQRLGRVSAPLILFLGPLLFSTAAQARSPQDLEGTWPREINAAEARITVHQPQLESLKGNRLVARVAISVLNEGASTPIFGAAWLRARLIADPQRGTA